MVSYFSRVLETARLFLRCFERSYSPPSVDAPAAATLDSAISLCSTQGKLLVLHLTVHGRASPLPLAGLPAEDFHVFTVPFLAVHSYESARALLSGPLPFVGLFFCPSGRTADAQFLARVATADDLLRAPEHARKCRRELLEKRARFRTHQSTRVIVSEQDLAYEEAVAEAKRRDAERERLRSEAEQREAQRTEKIAAAVRRFNSLPQSAALDPGARVSIQFRTSRGAVRERDFARADTVDALFAFVERDYAPKEPVLRYGFPPKSLRASDRRTTLADLRFSKKEVVQVLTDSDDGE
jgi:hypothetical protein